MCGPEPVEICVLFLEATKNEWDPERHWELLSGSRE